MNNRQYFRIAKALADPQRFKILEAIAGNEEISCGLITERFPVAQATVSHHLKLLTDADIISVRREGQHGFFSCNNNVIEEYLDEIKNRLAIKK